MASPPPSISFPRKRPAVQTASLAPSKRRKPSSARVPSHLRQTSFPPSDDESALSPPASALSPPASALSLPGGPRSRELSVDSALNTGAAPSVRSGRSGGRKGKKAGATAAAADADIASVRHSATGVEDEANEDEADDDELREAEANITGDQTTEAELKHTQKNLR